MSIVALTKHRINNNLVFLNPSILSYHHNKNCPSIIPSSIATSPSLATDPNPKRKNSNSDNNYYISLLKISAETQHRVYVTSLE